MPMIPLPKFVSKWRYKIIPVGNSKNKVLTSLKKISRLDNEIYEHNILLTVSWELRLVPNEKNELLVL